MSSRYTSAFSWKQILGLLLYALVGLAICVVAWPVSSSPPWYIFPGIQIAVMLGGIAILMVFARND